MERTPQTALFSAILSIFAALLAIWVLFKGIALMIKFWWVIAIVLVFLVIIGFIFYSEAKH